VCGLALVNRVTLGLPFARYFLCLVMGEAPTELPDLQRELAEEDPSLLSEAVFLSQPLVISGLEDCLQFQRQTSMDASGLCPVPLSADPEAVVTDADKDVYLHRYLEHKLVRTIEAQADAFRQGVESVTGKAGLSLLSAAELKQLWGGHEVDDARLDLWRSRTRVAGVPPLLVGHFWEYLRQSKPSKRAQVLQFATGAARLPSDVEMAQGWTFSIQASTSFPTIEPTPSNGLTGPAMCARASTCSKTIYLPPYEGMDALQRGLDCSLMDGGFGTA